MHRKRDGLVPIAEALADLPAPLQAFRKSQPPAQRGFTRFDQVDQLVGASEADPDLGFMARLMALCSLPRTNPGNRKEYVRRNGPYTLGMSAGINNRLPYGNLPRLLLAWVSTEAVRTQSRVLLLGDSVSEFMRKLDIYSTSGRKYSRLREQMQRLFNAHVQLIYEAEHSQATVNALIARRTELWWNPKRPDERTLWKSKIELSEDFFNEIIQHPVPLDMNTLKALKRSSLGLDWYLWLTYRTFTLNHPLRLSWTRLYQQFGAVPSRAGEKLVVNDFRKDCLRELKKIKTAWPELNYATAKGVLILSPTAPKISSARQLRLGE